MAKVFISAGHGGSDPGAVGIVTEKVVNLEMALACRDYLVKNGVEVKMSREKDENDPVSDEVRECNAYNPDLAISAHNNSGGGKGFEVYHYSKGGKSKELAQNIEKEVIAIGQNSRGCKTRVNSNGTDYYAFIRETKAPAVICEGFFVDNPTDAQIGDTIEEQRAFGIAYAKGILKTLGITPKQETNNNAENNSDTIYRVQVGAFKDKTNAEKLVQALKEKGYADSYIRK